MQPSIATTTKVIDLTKNYVCYYYGLFSLLLLNLATASSHHNLLRQQQQHSQQPLHQSSGVPELNGFFWQVTDFHFDMNYSLTGDPDNMCHSISINSTNHLGAYGDYACDSPWSLVKSAIEAMKKFDAYPDFILWTGDSVPHINGSEYGKSDVYLVVQAVTNALRDAYPHTSIYPSFGNHDPYPTNMMPIADPIYYRNILNFSDWDELIPTSARENFLKGGYYSDIYGVFKIINVNTALYYTWNNLTTNHTDDDPTGQLAWLESELIDAKAKQKRVFIAAHVPPGAFEKGKTFKWFHDGLNKAYLDVVTRHSDVIAAHFYGHEHTDSFRILQSNTENADPVGVMFLSPAVTPWRSTLPGVGSNNPSIRLYEYDVPSGIILNYRQYYLNLTLANSGNATWELEYSFKDTYSVPDISPKSAKEAFDNIFETKGSFLEKYLLYNSVSENTSPDCDDACLRNHLCAVSLLDYEQYDLCMAGSHLGNLHHHRSTRHPHYHHSAILERYMMWAVCALVISIFCLALVLLCVCIRRQHRYTYIGRGWSYSIAPIGYGTISNES